MSGAGTSLGRAWRWWRDALAAAMRPNLDPGARGALCLTPEPDGFVLRGADGAEVRLPTGSRPDRATRARIGRARRRYLDLDADDVLDIRGALPAAAADDPREAIGLRMAELTPFREEEVLFDISGLDRVEGGGIAFRALVTPRAPVEGHLAGLGRLGIRVDGVTASALAGAGAGEAPDFMPEIAGRRVRRKAWAMGGLGLVFAGSLAALAILHAERQTELRAAHRAALEELVAEIRAAEAVEADVMRLSRALVAPQSRRDSEISTLDLLQGIAAVLPDEIHLEHFEREGREVKLTGYAPDATAVIGLLEGLPLLSGVRFSAPVARDGRVGLDRFAVTADAAASASERVR